MTENLRVWIIGLFLLALGGYLLVLFVFHAPMSLAKLHILVM